jgi:hypothetical protein
MKVTVYLMKEHEALRSLFSQFKKGNRAGRDKKSLFDEIQREMTVQSQMETEIFYPALQNSPSTRGEELVEAAMADHEAVDRLLNGLQQSNANEKTFDARMSQLINAVIAHMEREEDEMFDEARKSLSELRLEELGLEMEDRRRILTLMAA